MRISDWSSDVCSSDLAYWGWKGGYFDSEADASAYFDEMRFMLAAQIAAPNSPQWFNTGLHWAYGIDGPAQGHHYVDFKTGELRSEEHTSELQSLMRISYAVFCLKKKITQQKHIHNTQS